MQLKNMNAEIFIPDGDMIKNALEKTTHMSIAAHQDDIELMSLDGILKCFGVSDQWFTGVVVTNGGGSPREGIYANFTDEQMQEIRKKEQKKAAVIGEYGAQVLMGYSSSDVKKSDKPRLVEELVELIKIARPTIIYTHNLADKHDTHVATAVRVIQALRELPKEYRLEKIYGCEVWRNLDWLLDEDKVAFDLSSHQNIGAALVSVFDSQISGGKRYDLAIAGRKKANATFSASHALDLAEEMSFAMDLTPLITDANLEIGAYIDTYLSRFAKDVKMKIGKFE
ncbi:MAG: PIG-L family deacetylase [Peptostreptococcaceae bacterium]|nr:PIG-L family deacetylase [Peptostreptococcaceae bacterium]